MIFPKVYCNCSSLPVRALYKSNYHVRAFKSIFFNLFKIYFNLFIYIIIVSNHY